MRHVPFGQRWLAPLLLQSRGLGPRLAGWESSAVRERIRGVQTARPVWICGMARSGSTLLLQLLDALPCFTSHRYSDYPWLWTPYWWNHLYSRLPLPQAGVVERAHRDSIKVTRDSPEAFEEIFWMHFFDGRHDPGKSQVLGAETRNEEFENFFALHQRKLLTVRGAQRYLAKANYQLARLAYLHQCYPQARFVIPVREPLAQVASLLRQDDLFCQLNREDAAVSAHMARIGHFEFGAQKRAFNLGDRQETQVIADAFARGDRTEAFARQWAVQYGYALARMREDASLANACLWLDHDRLRVDSSKELIRLAQHLQLNASERQRLLESGVERIRPTQDTRSAINEDDISSVRRWTSDVWTSIQEWTQRPAPIDGDA